MLDLTGFTDVLGEPQESHEPAGSICIPAFAVAAPVTGKVMLKKITNIENEHGEETNALQLCLTNSP